MKLFVKWERTREIDQEGQTGRAAAGPGGGDAAGTLSGRAGQREPMQTKVGPQAQLLHMTRGPVTVPDSASPHGVPSSGVSTLDS